MALVFTGLVWRIRRSDPRTGEFHAKALFAAPATAEQAERAATIMGAALVRTPSQRAATVLADAILVMAVQGASASEVADAARPLFEVEMRMAFPGLRTLTNGLINRGHPAAMDVAEQVVGVDHRGATELAHSAAVRVGDYELAQALAEGGTDMRWMTAPVAAGMEAERALGIADAETALRVLDTAPTERPSAFSSRYLTAAVAAGNHERVIEYLDCIVHNLSVAVEAQFRFEAHWALGDVVSASMALEVALEAEPLNALVLRLNLRAMRHQHGAGSDRVLEQVRSLERELEEPTMADITALMASYFELESLEDVVRIGRTIPEELFSPASRIHFARARYVMRDFAGALEALEPLHGSWWRWDSEKLRARIFLETGNPETALALRDHRPPSGDLDEVEFHALLSLHREDEAFTRYLPRTDRQNLRQVFPRTAHVSGPLEHVTHRLVAAQAGPGDEIMLASLYREAACSSERLSVTCEPRLEPLLRRSFPEIEFLPVRRLKPNEFGWRRDAPDRVEAGPLGSLLDSSALSVGRAADSEVLGRSLPEAVGSAGLPAAGYLTPSQAGLDLARARRGSQPLIGVVWRSEMRSPMRDVHYLSVDDLDALLPPGVEIACLQHDVTEGELNALSDISHGSLIDLTDVDLRNDFDTSAAVVASCDVVVGIGTTMVELAGAVGTPTVMMQPTHFGTWRANPYTDVDYWHASAVVARVERPWETVMLIEKARQQLEGYLED